MIVKCSHCGVIIASKDFDSHKCDLSFNESKIIEVVYFRDDSHKGKQIVTVLGLDKVLYTFEVVPRKPIPLVLPLSDDFSQQKPSHDNFTDSLRIDPL